MLRNISVSGNSLILDALEALRRRLPEGWTLLPARFGSRASDATTEVRAPDGTAGRVLIEARNLLEPKGVLDLAARARVVPEGAHLLVVSPYLSSSTTERLRSFGLSYLDLTGNSHIVISKPGLFVESQGAAKAPGRVPRPARSLKGPKAGRVVRALVDRKVPLGVREIATLTGVDAGYVSRILSFLDSEALVARAGRGRIREVDWVGLLRRWAREAPIDSRGVVRAFLEPRGLKALFDELRRFRGDYAVSGGFAAARLAPVAPPRLAIVWVRPTSAGVPLPSLRPAESGANVLLVEPLDGLVFEGLTESEGIRYAAPSQVAVDLLTSPGRGPAEGEALLAWMQQNEESWRG